MYWPWLLMWSFRTSRFCFSCTYTDETPMLSFMLSGNKHIWKTRSTDHHTSIHMHILMTHITFTYIYPFLISTVSLHVSFLLYFIYFHVIFHFTSYSCNCILSSHSSAMLLISYHMLYIYLSFPFMFHAYKNLRSG